MQIISQRSCYKAKQTKCSSENRRSQFIKNYFLGSEEGPWEVQQPALAIPSLVGYSTGRKELPLPPSPVSHTQKADCSHSSSTAAQQTQTLLDPSLFSTPSASTTAFMFCLPKSLLKFLHPPRPMPNLQCPIYKLGMPMGAESPFRP